MDQPAPADDPQSDGRDRGRRGCRALALVAALHGLMYCVLLAPWMGEDEPFHLENAALVARGHVLGKGPGFSFEEVRERPLTHLQARRSGYGDDLDEIAEVEDGIIASMRETGFWRRVDWASRDEHPRSFDALEIGSGASHQPRLYYALLAPFVALAPSDAPLAQLYVARGVSLLLFVGTVLLAYGAARRALPDGPGAMLAGLGVALWPMSARMAAVVNNDVLARFLVAAALYLAARWIAATAAGSSAGSLAAESLAGGPERARARALPLLLLLVGASALAVFTKPTGATAVVVAGLALLLHPAASRRLVQTLLALLALGGVLGAGALSYFSQHHPGLLLGLEGNWVRFKQGIVPGNLAELCGTLVGRYHWESRAPSPDPSVPVGWGLLALVVAGGVALARTPAWAARRVLVLAWGASLAQLLLVLTRGVGKGRYLMPAAPALAILVVVGLLVLMPERHHRRVATAAACGLALFSAFFALTGLVHENWIAWGS